MTKDTVGEWDTTAGNNADVGGINIAEGAHLNTYNNAMREMMAQVAKALYGGAVSPAAYGVTGDGSTDDAAAFNAAMLAASTAGKAVIIDAPASSYRMTAPINIYTNTVLMGDPRIVKPLFRFERCNAINLANSEDGDETLTESFRLQNMLFFGDDDTATDGSDFIGLNIRRAKGFHIDNVDVRGFTDAVVVDGRKNTSGNVIGCSDGIFTGCDFLTDDTSQQVNSTNNYPRYLVEATAEASGAGGPDGIAFYRCKLYGEQDASADFLNGDGSTTLFAYSTIPSGKVLTDAAHLQVQYVASAGGSITTLMQAVDFSVADVSTNTPDIDFTGGSSPLGAPAQVQLLSTTGDGATKNFRLTARPSFPSSASGRAVFVTVAAAEQAAGTAYEIIDANNKSFTFTADAGADTLSITATQAEELAAGRIVRVSSTGALPTGLSAATDYFATAIDAAAGTFKLATTYANAVAGTPTVVNITGAGSGTHTVTVENAIEFVATPANTAAIVVDDVNLRVRWIDPNADACAKLCRGAQRFGFFSCLIGGGKIGIDFDHATRCTAIDTFFQIHEYAVNFDEDAEENQLVGYSARSDSTLISGFAQDNATTPSNSFDEWLGQATSIRNFVYIKDAYDEPDADAARIRKTGTQLQLDIVDATGTVRLGVGGSTMLQVDGNNGRVTLHASDGTELWRIVDGGLMTPRLTSGTQGIGDSSHVLSELFANLAILTDGVTAPSATVGFAKLFVDTADGDLKVIFGDGTTKTIVTDT